MTVPLGNPVTLGATGVTTTARYDRIALGSHFRPLGTPMAAGQGMLVGPTGTNGELTLLSDVLLRVAPFVAVVQGTHSTLQGQYVVPNTAQRDLAVPAKDAAQSRRVLVQVRVADSLEAGVASSATTDGAWLELKAGALAASNPVLPGVDANAVAAGELLIPSTASGLPVTLTRYNPRAIMRGQVWPVDDEAARLAIPAADRYPGLEVLALTTGRLWLYNGVKWLFRSGPVPSVMTRRTGVLSMPNGQWFIWPWETAPELSDASMWNIANPARLVAPIDGIYMVTTSLAIAEGHGTASLYAGIAIATNLRRGPGHYHPNVNKPGEFGFTTRAAMAAGQYAEGYSYNAETTALLTGSGELSPRMEMTWIGNY